ncbi:YlxR family protein [Knoellia sinensis]|uniref:YlxR family protein n=1 Tax=Knoellia sinensis TaxID=136100 RepID=UPI000A038C66|nr:YlxR family protein [Knoellia sinensis]
MGGTDRTGLRARALHAEASTRHTSSSDEPVRTCVGCRATDSRSALLRVVVGDHGDLVPDLRRCLPGRGAWLHPTGDCFDLAVRRRAFGRALRVSAPLDASAVAEWITTHEQTTVRTKGTD